MNALTKFWVAVMWFETEFNISVSLPLLTSLLLRNLLVIKVIIFAANNNNVKNNNKNKQTNKNNKKVFFPVFYGITFLSYFFLL